MNTNLFSLVASVGLAASGAAAQCGGSSYTSSSDCSSDKDWGAVTIQTASYDHHEHKNIVETAAAAGSFNTLIAAAKAAGLADTLMGEGPFTVFAPTDEAFAKLPEGTVESLLKPENRETLQAILLYHVVPGKALAKDVVSQHAWETAVGQRVDITTRHGGAQIDRVDIIKTDILASNGVIHVIDEVLMPETKTIPEVAAEAGSFRTLLAAVKAAGLADTLMGEGPFTVFAPTDEAFQALGATVPELLLPENRDKLTDILTYHVIPARVYADQAVEARKAKTLQGDKVKIRQGEHDAVTINDATVIAADVEAANGVIHVIDTVLLPH